MSRGNEGNEVSTCGLLCPHVTSVLRLITSCTLLWFLHRVDRHGLWFTASPYCTLLHLGQCVTIHWVRMRYINVYFTPGNFFSHTFWPVSSQVALYNPSSARRSSQRWKRLLWFVIHGICSLKLSDWSTNITDPIVVELLVTTIFSMIWSGYM